MLYVQAETADWKATVPLICWEQLAQEVLRRHGMDLNTVDFTVNLVGRETMRSYHQRYRGYAKDTDVMAFPDHSVDLESHRLYLGDVLLCFPVAREQAQQAGHDLAAELCLLFVHGLLHLLGYDDETPQERARMWQVQREVLETAQVPLRDLP